MNFKTSFIRAAVVSGGVLYLLTGAALLFAPEWFFQNVGTFPPFNRHYAGDLGSFLLPLGLTLLWAARNPGEHWLLIGFAALGSLVHALNHTYDDLTSGEPMLGQTIPLYIATIALVLATLWARQTHRIEPLRLKLSVPLCLCLKKTYRWSRRSGTTLVSASISSP